jgi:hypothetical protein
VELNGLGLPTLYSAFNRREDEVSLLNARAGVPTWGPELLARTHYALGSGTSTIDTLPDLYERWDHPQLPPVPGCGHPAAQGGLPHRA